MTSSQETSWFLSFASFLISSGSVEGFRDRQRTQHDPVLGGWPGELYTVDQVTIERDMSPIISFFVFQPNGVRLQNCVGIWEMVMVTMINKYINYCVKEVLKSLSGKLLLKIPSLSLTFPFHVSDTWL